MEEMDELNKSSIENSFVNSKVQLISEENTGDDNNTLCDAMLTEYFEDEEYLEDSDSSIWDQSRIIHMVKREPQKSDDEMCMIGFTSSDFFSEDDGRTGVKKKRRKSKIKKCISANGMTKKDRISNSYTCEYCWEKFDRIKLLTEHKDTIHREIHLTCGDCNKTFKSSKNLKQHRVIHLNVGKNFSCELCGACFIEKRRLNLHKLIHLENKPIQCHKCDKTFSHRSNYMRHLVFHSGLKPFQCECGRNFSNSTKLKYHRKSHVKTLDE